MGDRQAFSTPRTAARMEHRLDERWTVDGETRRLTATFGQAAGSAGWVEPINNRKPLTPSGTPL